MKNSRDRAEEYENRELVATTKALIALYKSAFGESWEQIFRETVRLSLS